MRHSHVAILLALCLASLAYGDDGRDPNNRPSGNPAEPDLLKVFDGQGRYVGPLVAFNDAQVATVIVANNATVVVPLSRSSSDAGLTDSASQYEWGSDLGSSAYYPTTDCSGQPFINADSPVRPSTTLREGATATVYISPDIESSTITLKSQGLPGSCEELGANPSVPPTQTEEGWEPASMYSLTQHYPEPLSVHY